MIKNINGHDTRRRAYVNNEANYSSIGIEILVKMCRIQMMQETNISKMEET